MKGTFIFQRKVPGKTWSDYKELDLSKLKAEEWIKLELKASELRKLVLQVISLYRLYTSAGIPLQETRLIRADVHLEKLLQLDDERLTRLLDLHQTAGFDAFSRLLEWALRTGDLSEVVERLEMLNTANLSRLNQAVSVTTLKTALAIWEENQASGDEELWQRTLTHHTFVLSQVFASPIVIIAGIVYMGGKSVKNAGGNVLDILAATCLTGNAVLSELKTPTTPLLGHQYREDIFNISEEVSGAVPD